VTPLSAILDHLWQSTLLALAIALLVLALRKAPAAVRHGLWFAASIKFLIPFAALASLGRLLAPRLPAILHQFPPEAAPAAVLPQAALIGKAAQPLARFPFAPSPLLRAPLSPAEAGPSATQALHQSSLHLDPVMILLAVWALGCGALLLRWVVRSARVHRMVRASAPLAWPAPMPVVASPSQIGPGLVGLWRPVLVAPRTLSEHLTRPEIDAIIAHEACHLRRRDNLTAALHALVEAVFWFHPMVWWIGARMIVERERACDEAVLHAGHDRRAYARSLVETARLYVQSPLSCVAGASGVDLKTRVERIMTAPLASPLSRSKKALLLAAASFAFATPVAAGLLTPQARQAVAPLARAMAAIAAPARALGVAPDQAAKPVILARNEALLAPKIAVTATDVPPVVLSQNLPAPHVDPAPSPAPRPTELAAVAPPAPTAQAAEPASPFERAASFVRSYAASTARREAIARWLNPICVRVVGLTDDQGAAVRARVAEVGKGLGVEVQPAGCQRANIEIGFTTDPQHMLDDVIKTNGRLMGDPSSGTQQARTVTLPIQAWYLTNGRDVAANDSDGLKALAAYRPDDWAALKTPVQYWYPGPGQPTPSSNWGVGNYQPSNGGNVSGWSPPWDYPSTDNSRQFFNVFVIVDVKRTGSANLRLLSDYVTMLAFSQPQSLGSCQALPSITDLFATCPGRAAPDGLTLADTSYLHALYAANPGKRIGGHPAFAQTQGDHPALLADVVDGMAPLLANAKVIVR
jgi:beta-lactamase regulating signal transducer with metallopeptidase domain